VVGVWVVVVDGSAVSVVVVDDSIGDVVDSAV
jgi:hypothetical protein